MKIKACVNCEYFDEDGKGCNYGKQPMTRNISYITGKITYRRKWLLAETMRSDNLLFSILWNTCGKRAKWFKQKGD